MSEPLWTPTPEEIAALRRVLEQQDARIAELEQEKITLWHTINTQATYAEELEAQLAERWEPDDLSFNCGAATIGQIGDQLFVELYGETLQVELPADIRLSRRITFADELYEHDEQLAEAYTDYADPMN